MSTTSFTLFLAKASNQNYLDFLTSNAQIRAGTNTHQALQLNDFSENAELHIFKGISPPPKWLRNLSLRVEGIELFDRRSVAAVLFFYTGTNTFAVTFAHGWMLLDDTKFEADFGLRVAINALDPTKLKRLERSNLGDAMQGVSQSSFQREFRSFGIDDALDLVRKLSGATNEDSALQGVTGSRSLKLTGEFELDDLPNMADELIELFESEDYKNTPFGIMDSVRPENDATIRSELFDLAVQSIRQQEDRFELSLPSNTEAEGVSFKFLGPGLRRTYPDLLLRHYFEAMGEKLDNISIDTLNDHKITSIFDDDRPNLTWPLKRSLVGSISRGGMRYAINDGQWFRVDDVFRTSVETAFETAVRGWNVPRPSPPTKRYEGNRGTIEREDIYNERIAQELDLSLLDKRLITIPDVTRSGFEPCDLLDVPNRRFIHVKKSSRRSNILSHFFKQGSNSAQQFRKIPATWVQLAEMLHEIGRNHDESLIRELINTDNFDGWTCEFWIADSPREGGEFNIPFFSKITLRDELSALRAMQFDVAIRFIEVQPDPI